MGFVSVSKRYRWQQQLIETVPHYWLLINYLRVALFFFFLLDAAPNGLAPNQLAEKAGITRATVTGLLDGLQREDLIERKIDLQDRRALNIHLTPQGKQTAQQVIGQHSQWIASLFNHLSLSERHQLSTLLNKVSNGLKDNTP